MDSPLSGNSASASSEAGTQGRGSVLLFVILGCVTLASWNFYLTALGFFILYFPGANWAFTASMVYQTTNVVGTAFMVKFGHRIRFKTAYIVSLMVQMVLVVALPALAFWSGSFTAATVSPSTWGISLALLACAGLGVSESVFVSLILGRAGSLDDPKMMQGIMTGQGIIGVLCPALVFLFKFLAGDAMAWKIEAVFAFFGTCVALQAVGVCLVNRIPDVPKNHAGSCVEAVHSFREGAENEGPSPTALVPDAEDARSLSAEKRSISELLRDASPQLSNVFLNFLVTFIVFPGVAASWAPQLPFFKEKGSLGQEFYTTAILGIFQVFDVVGRSATGWLASKGLMTEKRAWIPTWTRFLFIPLFIVLQRDALLIPVPFQDLVEAIAMALFAFTNGWCATMAMMYGPQCVKDPAEQHTVGIIMELGLVNGIFLGSLVALATQIGA